jgi:putative Mg2+ transporter-C (MgtC) family protein
VDLTGDFHVADVVRVLAALVIGSAIGAEREYRSKAAGLRTLALICMGSAVFTILSLRLGAASAPERIASNIITGIGFLGAGVIFKDGLTISGLTTATSIWVTAALGMAVGGGEFWLSAIGLVLVLLVLGVFQRLQDLIDHVRETRSYKFQFSTERLSPSQLEQKLQQCRLQFALRKVLREGTTISCWYDICGNARSFRALSDFSLNTEDLLSSEYW